MKLGIKTKRREREKKKMEMAEEKRKEKRPWKQAGQWDGIKAESFGREIKEKEI